MKQVTKPVHSVGPQKGRERGGDPPPAGVMATRVALAGAVGAVIFWSAKAIAIGIAGGLGKSPAEDALFFLGLASALAGAAALGYALAARRRAVVRVVSAAGGVVAIALVAGLTQLVVNVVSRSSEGWAWGEVNLWVSALALITAALAWRWRQDRS